MIFDFELSFLERGGVVLLQGFLRFPPCFWMVNRGGFVVI
jgi:hypothetical protein